MTTEGVVLWQHGVWCQQKPWACPIVFTQRETRWSNMSASEKMIRTFCNHKTKLQRYLPKVFLDFLPFLTFFCSFIVSEDFFLISARAFLYSENKRDERKQALAYSVKANDTWKAVHVSVGKSACADAKVFSSALLQHAVAKAFRLIFSPFLCGWTPVFDHLIPGCGWNLLSMKVYKSLFKS